MLRQYRRIYPCARPERQQAYEHLLELSAEVRPCVLSAMHPLSQTSFAFVTSHHTLSIAEDAGGYELHAPPPIYDDPPAPPHKHTQPRRLTAPAHTQVPHPNWTYQPAKLLHHLCGSLVKSGRKNFLQKFSTRFHRFY